MTALKVNGDYESVLFYGKSGSSLINETLEFLVFFLDDRPLYTNKKYDQSYLKRVEVFTGKKPRTISTGKFINWWGPLLDLKKEKKLNSKITSAELILKEGWCSDTHIIMGDFSVLDRTKTYLLKNPYGMSGQKFQLLRPHDPLPESGEFIAEPFLNRKFDFSHYVFPDGSIKSYQNIVDEKFQYKGTICTHRLSFQDKISDGEWLKFEEALKIIIAHYYDPQMPCGFSIDSFVYEEKGELKIRFLSEVNYRRTMGSVALELKDTFAKDKNWSLLLLGKDLSQKFSLEKNLMILSPGDTRFDLVFCVSDDKNQIQKLLADGHFPIEI